MYVIAKEVTFGTRHYKVGEVIENPLQRMIDNGTVQFKDLPEVKVETKETKEVIETTETKETKEVIETTETKEPEVKHKSKGRKTKSYKSAE